MKRKKSTIIKPKLSKIPPTSVAQRRHRRLLKKLGGVR